uniref:FCP1 homology domain-containing protein n=1 Tax=Trypanosoma congolense (strain IL3000) TaxID=1068625 RepID=G0UJZ1_TRYCI|nr:conserved hypothetical protein [Trypanosoma congolense IL3000]
MSHDAMSFFRGLSAKISATKGTCTKKAHWRLEDEMQPQQPIVPLRHPTPPPLSTTANTHTIVVDGPTPTSTAASSSRMCTTTSASWRASGTGAIANESEGNRYPVGTCSIRPSDQQEEGEKVEEFCQVSSSIVTQVLRPASMGCRADEGSSSSGVCVGFNSGWGVGKPPDKRGVGNGYNNCNNGVCSINESNGGCSGSGGYEAAVSAQLQRIQRTPKNTSPVNARHHASLLPRQPSRYRGKVTLILDLDETLVHSSLTCQPRQHDLVLDVRMDNTTTTVYVAFRPHMREFLRAVAPLFEVIIFTASVSVYCNQLMDAIDSDNILGSNRLYREHCSILNGAYVKDLSLLGRDLDRVVIVDNSPVAYLFQQRNAIPIPSWFDDPSDNELQQLIPLLETLASASDVYSVLDRYNAIFHLGQGPPVRSPTHR